MKEKYKIKDESGDRKYFTQIPNMIVNHSTAYEQSLYLIMKRIAGENRTCYASQNYLAEKMGVHKETVLKNINKLLKRKWIVEIAPVIIRGGKVRQFAIVDLWHLNMKEYESGAKTSRVEVGLFSSEVVLKPARGGAKTSTKKNQEEEYKNNVLAKPCFAGKEINNLIGLFNKLNPSYEQLFKNKSQRAAMERLIKKFGLDKVRRIIEFAEKTSGKQYAPTITTPIQLEAKLGDLIIFFNKEKNNEKFVFKI